MYLYVLNANNTRAFGRHIQAALEVSEISLERGEGRGKGGQMGHDTNPRAALAAPTGNYGERMALHSFPKMSGLLYSSNHQSKNRDHLPKAMM